MSHKTRLQRKQEALDRKQQHLRKLEEQLRTSVRQAKTDEWYDKAFVNVDAQKLLRTYIEVGHTENEAQGFTRWILLGNEGNGWVTGAPILY